MRLTSQNTPETFDALERLFYRGIPWLAAIATAGFGALLLAAGKPGGWPLLLLGGVLVLVGLLAILRTTARADRRVTIDSDRRELIFENYEVMRGFWPTRPVPRYVCGFDDIVGVERARPQGWGPEWLVVHGPRGRIRINSYHTNYAALSAALLAIAGPERLPLTRRDAFPAICGVLLIFAAVLLAFAMGWLP